MKQRGAHIRTNFGWQEFYYDLANIGDDQHKVLPFRRRIYSGRGATLGSAEESNYGADRNLGRWIPDENMHFDPSLSWSDSIVAPGPRKEDGEPTYLYSAM